MRRFSKAKRWHCAICWRAGPYLQTGFISPRPLSPPFQSRSLELYEKRQKIFFSAFVPQAVRTWHLMQLVQGFNMRQRCNVVWFLYQTFQGC